MSTTQPKNKAQYSHEIRLREIENQMDRREKNHDTTKTCLVGIFSLAVLGCLVCGVYKISLLGKGVAEAAASMITSFCVDKIMYYLVLGLAGSSVLVLRERAKGLTTRISDMRKQIEDLKEYQTSSKLDKYGHSPED